MGRTVWAVRPFSCYAAGSVLAVGAALAAARALPSKMPSLRPTRPPALFLAPQVCPSAWGDAPVQQYLTEYNKVYSRRYRAAGKFADEHSGRDLTEEQFKAWSVNASQARRDYVEGNISGEEMLARVRVD